VGAVESVLASLEIRAGLAEAAHRACWVGEPVVAAERVADALLGWLGADSIRWVDAPGFGPSGEGVPIEVEDEVEATLRLADWTARGRLRRSAGDPMPVWDERVRVGLGRALAAAEGSPIRYVGFKLLLRALLAECASPGEWMEFVRRFHLRPDEEFLADGTPDAAPGVALLSTFGLVAGAAAAVQSPLVRAAVRGDRRRETGPVELALREEAVRQAVRGGCALVGQAHLVMAMCALDYAMAGIGAGFTEAATPANGGAGALAAAGIGYARVKDFAEDLSPGPAEPPAGDRSWRRGGADPPFGTDLMTAFTEARRLATDLGHRHPGTTHLLYVVAADGAGPGARMLRAYGADPAALAVRLGRQLAP
jgi:hypothetical protein